MRILLTNDDSHDSPLFQFAIETFSKLGELRIVVPQREQSWTSKSMTRGRPLAVDTIKLGSREAYAVDGTPADCINLGVYSLFEQKPDLVVSGINIGINSGLSFIYSSGTVGACFEANIARIPALALSQFFVHEPYRRWLDERTFSDALTTRLAAQTSELIEEVLTRLMPDGVPWKDPVTWNVNFPFERTEESEFRFTRVAKVFYKSCYVKHGDQYRYEFDKALTPTDSGPEETNDGLSVKAGHISMSKIDISSLCGDCG